MQREFDSLVEKQSAAVMTLNNAMKMEPDASSDPVSPKSNQNAELLVRFDGEGWSEDVERAVESEMRRAKSILTRRATEDSQWRSLI